MYLLGTPRKGIVELDHDHTRVTQHFSTVNPASLASTPCMRREGIGWLQCVEHLGTCRHRPDPLAHEHVRLPRLALEYTSRSRRHLTHDVSPGGAHHVFELGWADFRSGLVVMGGDSKVIVAREACGLQSERGRDQVPRRRRL